jgi:hypothetical protein
VGASGYSGEALFFTPASGTTPASSREFVKTRYGGDFQLVYPRFKLQGEYVTARERGREPWGWDAQDVLNLDRGARTQLVAKYDEYDSDGLPVAGYSSTQLPGKVRTWNLGLIRYLDASTRLKLFYQIPEEENNEIDNNQATLELITLF